MNNALIRFNLNLKRLRINIFFYCNIVLSFVNIFEYLHFRKIEVDVFLTLKIMKNKNRLNIICYKH
jgi:hypothetical protein